MDRSYFIYSLITYELLGCFIATDIRVRASVQRHVLISLGCAPRSGTTEFYNHSVFTTSRKYQPRKLHHFTFPPAVQEGTDFSAFSSTLVIV